MYLEGEMKEGKRMRFGEFMKDFNRMYAVDLYCEEDEVLDESYMTVVLVVRDVKFEMMITQGHGEIRVVNLMNEICMNISRMERSTDINVVLFYDSDYVYLVKDILAHEYVECLDMEERKICRKKFRKRSKMFLEARKICRKKFRKRSKMFLEYVKGVLKYMMFEYTGIVMYVSKIIKGKTTRKYNKELMRSIHDVHFEIDHYEAADVSEISEKKNYKNLKMDERSELNGEEYYIGQLTYNVGKIEDVGDRELRVKNRYIRDFVLTISNDVRRRLMFDLPMLKTVVTRYENIVSFSEGFGEYMVGVCEELSRGVELEEFTIMVKRDRGYTEGGIVVDFSVCGDMVRSVKRFGVNQLVGEYEDVKGSAIILEGGEMYFENLEDLEMSSAEIRQRIKAPKLKNIYLSSTNNDCLRYIDFDVIEDLKSVNIGEKNGWLGDDEMIIRKYMEGHPDTEFNYHGEDDENDENDEDDGDGDDGDGNDDD